MRALQVKADATPSEVVRIPSPAMSSVNFGSKSRIFSQAIMAKLLTDLTEYFGVSWGRVQITDCADLWSSEYYWMTMAEIKLFLTKVKTGQYTKKDFRHLTPHLLMGWLDDYASDLLVNRIDYYEEKEAAERREKLIAMDNDPSLVAFDAGKVFQSLGVKLSEDGKTPEQVEKERIYQQEKAKQKAREQLNRDLFNAQNNTDENGNV